MALNQGAPHRGGQDESFLDQILGSFQEMENVPLEASMKLNLRTTDLAPQLQNGNIPEINTPVIQEILEDPFADSFNENTKLNFFSEEEETERINALDLIFQNVGNDSLFLPEENPQGIGSPEIRFEYNEIDGNQAMKALFDNDDEWNIGLNKDLNKQKIDVNSKENVTKPLIKPKLSMKGNSINNNLKEINVWHNRYIGKFKNSNHNNSHFTQKNNVDKIKPEGSPEQLMELDDSAIDVSPIEVTGENLEYTDLSNMKVVYSEPSKTNAEPTVYPTQPKTTEAAVVKVGVQECVTPQHSKQIVVADATNPTIYYLVNPEDIVISNNTQVSASPIIDLSGTVEIKPDYELPQSESIILPSVKPKAPKRQPSKKSISTVSRSKRKPKRPGKYSDFIQLETNPNDDELILDEDLTNDSINDKSDINSPSTSRGKRRNESHLSPAEKYLRIRSQNNISSRKCREKKKEERKQVANSLPELEKRNQELNKKYKALLQHKQEFEKFVHQCLKMKVPGSQQ